MKVVYSHSRIVSIVGALSHIALLIAEGDEIISQYEMECWFLMRGEPKQSEKDLSR